MSELINKLNYLQETKNQIKSAIVGKGVTVDSSTPFRDYAGAINNIGTGTSSPLEWSESYLQGLVDNSPSQPEVRTDWISLPPVTAEEQVIYYVMNIIDGIDNPITLNSISNNYTVDWGMDLHLKII